MAMIDQLQQVLAERDALLIKNGRIANAIVADNLRLRTALRALTTEIATNPVLIDNISLKVYEDAVAAEAASILRS